MTFKVYIFKSHCCLEIVGVHQLLIDLFLISSVRLHVYKDQ